jgi:hypothetical protein
MKNELKNLNVVSKKKNEKSERHLLLNLAMRSRRFLDLSPFSQKTKTELKKKEHICS